MLICEEPVSIACVIVLYFMAKIFDLFRKLNILLSKPQKYLGLVVFICSILAAVFELLGVSVIVPLINVLVDPQQLLNNKYVLIIIPNSTNTTTSITEENRRMLVIFVIIGVIIIYLIKNAFFIFNTWLKNKYAFKVQREMSVAMMKKYISNGYQFFLNHNYSELRQGIDGDVRSLYYIVSGILQIITQVLIVGLIGIYMLYKDWKLATGAIVTGAMCILLVLGIFRRKMAEGGKISRKMAIAVEKTMEETLHGIKLVLLSHKDKYFTDKFNDEVVRRNRIDVAITTGSEVPMYIIEAVSITGIMLSLCTRIISMDNPEAYVAVLGSFAVGMFRILPAIGKLSSSVNSIISSIPGLNSIYKNMMLESTSAGMCDRVIQISKKEMLADRIEAKNISFKYAGSDKVIFDKVSFVIDKGTSVGIIGESGAGKSTLADILLGLLAPTSGEILIDDVSMTSLYASEWKGIGYVPQTIFLTDSTIAENVAYGIDEYGIDREKVREALARANVLEFVETLPEAMDTMVGDRGVRLSGGQRQRIGIARALYTSPDILILDEATSALDNDTEKAVMEAIERLQGEITLIIIAHRLSTIKNCDRILEVKNGHIYERNIEEIQNES